MQRATAARLLDQIAGRRALCVGDILLDSFVYGHTERVSREAPVPILNEHNRVDMLGGAGNLARNINSLGGVPVLVGVIGDDEAGASISALVKEACGSTDGLVEEAGRRSPTKIRYVAQNQQMLCVDRDPVVDINEETETGILNAVRAVIETADVVILSDYGRGMLTRTLTQGVIGLARDAGIPVTVDPRGLDFSRYDGASVIKPNAGELAEETGLPVVDDASAEIALKALKDRLLRTDALLVTRGGQGMSLLEKDGEIVHHKARPRSVFDVSGAGDTALASLSLAVAANIDLSDAMALADLAAGTAVTKSGTATVSPEEVLQDADGGQEAPDWRIVSWQTALDLTDTWRREGLRVGFTNGCFDILHPGHLSVLRHAASVCDRLIVGLNSDASVGRLKGPERPINKAQDRAIMLASLEMVDRVVIFDEDTPQELIETINPHALIKGADYVADDLPGAAFIKANGGEVILAPLMKDKSTTAIVDKLKT